jgi:hypothetical protein
METTENANSTVVTVTVVDLLNRAKEYIASGENALRAAAEDIAAAYRQGATQRHIAFTVGRSVSWVNAILQWQRNGFREETPFAALSKAKRERVRNSVRSSELHEQNEGTASAPDDLTEDSYESEDNIAVMPGRTVADDGAADDQNKPSVQVGAGEQPSVIVSPSILAPTDSRTFGSLGFRTPGVALLLGAVDAAVIDVTIKVGATVSLGDEFPDYLRAERGEVIWVSSAASPGRYLGPKFEAAGARRQAVLFQEAEIDGFGLPVRDIGRDVSRVRHTIRNGDLKPRCVIFDHFSEYFRFRPIDVAVRALAHAVEELGKIARDCGATLVVPCQVPGRTHACIDSAMVSVVTHLSVDALYVIKRSSERQNWGVVMPVRRDGTTDGRGFAFRLGQRNDERTVIWEAGAEPNNEVWQ